MTTRSSLVAALAATALLTMTGCGSDALKNEVHPSAAAVVDGTAIEVSQVDDLARKYCDFVAPQMQSPDQAVPMSLVRNASLNLLVAELIAEEYVEATGLDVSAARSLLRQQAEQQAIQSQIPEDKRDIYYRVSMQLDTQTIYLAAGGAEAFAAGNLPEQDAVQVGSALVREWAGDLEVDYDPKFADLGGEKYDVSASSLSKPVSPLAVLAASFDPAGTTDSDYLAGLPAEQKCG